MAITPLPPHPFSLRQLQYAVAVAEALSFRQAAQACRVSQPALSAQLAQLEQALGVRLFERDRRRVLPTGAGKLLVERARQLLIGADDLLSLARQAADPLGGTLRIGVLPTICPYWLPEVAPALRSAHPRLAAHWVEEKTAPLMQALHAGELDAAVVALEAELGEVEAQVLGADPFVLVAPRRHPLGASASPVQPGELRGTEVLLLEEGHCFRAQALSWCARARMRELEFRATSLTTLVQMVLGGAGVTLLPRLALRAELRRSGLRRRELAPPVPHRTLALVWRKKSPLGDALRTLATTLRGAFTGLDRPQGSVRADGFGRSAGK